MIAAGPASKSVLCSLFNACTDKSDTRFYGDKMIDDDVQTTYIIV